MGTCWLGALLEADCREESTRGARHVRERSKVCLCQVLVGIVACVHAKAHITTDGMPPLFILWLCRELSSTNGWSKAQTNPLSLDVCASSHLRLRLSHSRMDWLQRDMTPLDPTHTSCRVQSTFACVLS
ncbi:hypothetical protein H310_03394, partial [Aphanomyces invadans]